MAIQEEKITEAIEKAFEAGGKICTDPGNDGDPAKAVAQLLGQAIAEAIASLEIEYLGGLETPAGEVTGTFNYTIK